MFIIDNFLLISLAAIKVWFVFYGILLLLHNIFFTLFPTTIIGISLLYGLLYYFHLEPVNKSAVIKVLGEDLLQTDKELTFQTTSRLSQSQSPNYNGLNKTPKVNKNGSSGGLINGEIERSIIDDDDDGGEKYSMQIVGHRGAGFDAPENTLIAFRNCKARGCTAVEFDVGITKDGIAVLFHDDDLIRMTGVNKLLEDVTYEELSELELIHPLTKKMYSSERVPTFQEAIETCLELDLRFFIDIKDPRVVHHILTAYKENPAMYERAIVSSFNLKIIYDLRRADPKIMGCCAWRPGSLRYKAWDGSLKNLQKRATFFLSDWFRIILDTVHLWFISNIAWWFIGLSVVLLNKDGVRRDDLSRWSKKGVRVLTWTVNNPVEKLHTIQHYRVGYLTDTLDMPRVQSSYEFLTPTITSDDKVNVNFVINGKVLTEIKTP